MSAVFLAGMAGLALAVLVPWPAPGRSATRASFLLMAVAEVAVAVAGAGALTRPWTVGLDGVLALPSGLRADPLAGLFLLLTGAVGALVCLSAAASSLSGRATLAPRTPAAAALMLAALALTLTGADAFTLVAAWELLSFSFFALVLAGGRPHSRRAGVLTYLFGKSSGSLLLVGLLLLAAHSHTWWLDGIAEGATGWVRSLAYALLLAGFAVKVGLLPAHTWMPAGYEAAPPVVRALMAGVGVNAGFYGMWRVFELLGAPPTWLVVVVLLLAGLTALLGIAHASVQTHLPGVIAWSSVENAGLIVVGLGVAMVGARAGQEPMVAAGLLAGTLQVIAHAVAKATIFTASASFESLHGSGDLDRLRGSIWRFPVSGSAFVVAALSLAALPPSVGFVSEWFVLESLMQQFRVSELVLRLAMAAAGALTALTVGFAGVAFVRLVAFVALGRPASVARPERAHEVSRVGRVTVSVLALACLALAAASPAEIQVISLALAPAVSPSLTRAGVGSPWVLQPVYPHFSVLSPSWLWVVMPALAVLVLTAALLLSRGRMLAVRRVDPWRSASGQVAGRSSYTSFGFTNPTRKVLANVLLTRAQLVELERASGGLTGDESRGPAGTHLGYTSDVTDAVDRFGYQPLRAALLRMAATSKRLQSGHLGAYVGYVLLVLVALLALVAGMS